MSEKILIRSDKGQFIDESRKIPKANSRNATFENIEITEDRTLELSVSSELPYLRWSFFGGAYYEELSHDEKSIDLSRFNDSAMLLFNHNRDQYIGVIERAWIKDKKLMNVVRFDTHDLAEQIFQSVRSGIVKNVSIGYEILELEKTKEAQNEPDTYRANLWMPFETSLVTVPADATVGVGRQYFDFGDQPTEGKPKRDNAQELTPTKQSATETTATTPDTQQKSSGVGEPEENHQERELSEPDDNNTVSLMVETPTINKDDLLQQERERTNLLLADGQHWNCPDLAQKAINEGWTQQQFRSQILEAQGRQQQPVAQPNKPLNLEAGEARRYRISSAITAALNGGEWAENCLEKEVHEALVKQGRANGTH